MFRVFDSFSLFDVFSAGAVRSLLSQVRALFSNSDGVWIEFGDASQLNELYDQSGDVPASGDPVGLVLDQSQGAELGAEQCSDPSFDDPVEWHQPGEWVVSGGQATMESPTASYSLKNINGYVGTSGFYKLTITVSVNTFSVAIVDYLTDALVNDGILVPPGEVGERSVVLWLESNDRVHIRPNSPDSGVIVITDYSLKKLKGNHATQSVSNYRPTYGEAVDGTRYIEFDGLDDFIEIEVPAGGWSGTVVFGWVQGSYWANYDLAEGTWSFPDDAGNLYVPDDQLVAMVFKADGGEMTSQEKADALAYVQSKGAGGVDGWSGVSAISSYFYGQPITQIQAIDFSSAINAEASFRGTKLTSFDASLIPNVQNVERAWFGTDIAAFDTTPMTDLRDCSNAWRACTSLEDFDGSGFASMTAANDYCFSLAWASGVILNQSSVESILVNIDANGLNAPAAGPTIDMTTDGSPLTTAAQDAITSLKAKGWDPVIDGVSQ